MPGIFISHSSADKPLVRRIAAELLLEGVPVWLDQWEMQLGDSLNSSITSGIANAEFCIICISKSALKSKWVDRELQRALTREDRLKRVFALPVKLDAEDLPLEFETRIYADFSNDFATGMQTLLEKLRHCQSSYGTIADIEPVIPLLFLPDSISLNRSRLARHISQIAPKRLTVSPKVVCINSPDLDSLVDRVNAHLKELSTSSGFSAYEKVEETWLFIRYFMKCIPEGCSIILENIGKMNPDAASTSIQWFCKLMQCKLLSYLQGALPGEAGRISGSAQFAFASDLEFFKCLYSCDDVVKLDFWRENADGRDCISSYVDVRELESRGQPRWGHWRGVLDAHDSISLAPKYIIPFQLYTYLSRRRWGLSVDQIHFGFAGWLYGPG